VQVRLGQQLLKDVANVDIVLGRHLDVAETPVNAGHSLGGRQGDPSLVCADVGLVADNDYRGGLVALLVEDLLADALDLVERGLVVDAVD